MAGSHKTLMTMTNQKGREQKIVTLMLQGVQTLMAALVLQAARACASNAVLQ